MRIDRNREQELATTVQARRHALLDLLTPSERKTVRRVGSAEAITFEDAAREIAEDGDDQPGGRRYPITVALARYLEAVNRFWTHAQETGVAGYLVNTWRSKHKGYAWIEFELLECEALFKLRHFIGLFKPETGNLADYSLRGVHQHLTEFAAKQGPIEIPQKASRGPGAGPDSHRQSIDVMDERMAQSVEQDDDGVFRQFPDEGLAHNPTSAIHAFLDGDITEDDL